MKAIFTMCMLLCACVMMAQETSEQDSTKTSYLNEVVVSANRTSELRRNVAQQVEVINNATITTFNAQTSADLLQNSGMVAMQRSQQGGGSPILRGFEASRVLLVVDGVRMNNLIYRSGHLQNVITVDNNMLEKAEVLFGPSSTVYGSDALGGVVHFFTKNPTLSATGTLAKANTFVRYGSVNNEQTAHVDVNLGGKRFASLTSFTASNFGNLRMGERTNAALGEQFGVRTQFVRRAADNSGDVLVNNDDAFLQVGSAYKQWDFMQKFLFVQNENISHTLNFQYSTTNDVPRYDRLTDPGSGGTGFRFAEWYYGPQERLMTSYQMKMRDLGSFADNLLVTLSYQAIEESRHDRRFGNNNRRSRTENVDVVGILIDLSKQAGNHVFRYGFDGQVNALKSTAFQRNIVDGTTAPLNTRYPNGKNSLNTYALYATHTWNVSERLTISDGVRIATSSISATFNDNTYFPATYYNKAEQNLQYASGNVGATYTLPTWKFSSLVSTGYRVPNIDDSYKVNDNSAGSATGNGTLVIPNPELKPEQTVNGEVSITKTVGTSRIEGTLFATEFFNPILLLPSTLNGQSVVTYQSFDADVKSSQNADRGYIYGVSVAGVAALTNTLHVTASYNYTKGRVRTEPVETPLDHIAPTFGRIGIRYATAKFTGEVFSNYNGWKRWRNFRLKTEDNEQYAVTDRGMPAWYTLNLRCSYTVNKNFSVQTGLDNVLDLQYRLFASGISSPGRNVFVTLRASL